MLCLADLAARANKSHWSSLTQVFVYSRSNIYSELRHFRRANKRQIATLLLIFAVKTAARFIFSFPVSGRGCVVDDGTEISRHGTIDGKLNP